MAQSDGLDSLDTQIDALETSLGQTVGVMVGFDTELQRMRTALTATGQDLQTVEKGLSRGLRRAFDGLVFDGAKLSDAFEDIMRSMIDATYRAALNPVADHISGAVVGGIGGLVQSILPFADGAGFSQGRVMPFASGGVVNGPVSFPMRGGMGLMGEAGPEAIMPLARGPDGRLGVRGGGGGGTVNVVMNISTPDAQSFRRSEGQIAARMGRVLGRGQRNM